jgi:hypothetical protein
MIQILASFFDPDNNNFDIVDGSVVLAIIVAVTTLAGVGIKWLDGRIAHRTHQIQPDTNGGKSLTDLHKKVDQFAEYQRSVNDARDQSIDLIVKSLEQHGKRLDSHIRSHNGKD